MTDAEGLYRRLGPTLYRYAVALLADRAAAEDVVQQVFMTVLKNPHLEIRDEGHYMRRAIRNECYSAMRRSANNSAASPFLEDISGNTPDYDQRLALEQGLRTLPVEQREVVHLHAFEGLTFQSIADSTQTSPSTVAARYRYALAKLKAAVFPIGK